MITVRNLQKNLSLNPVSVKNTIRNILKACLPAGKACRACEAELTVVFVSRQKIAALNQRFLGRACATDVLAFDLREHRRGHLRGDVIISTDAVIQQAKAFGQSHSRELALYMIHGILHLLGYDDHRPKDIVKMRKEEERILCHCERSEAISGLLRRLRSSSQ